MAREFCSAVEALCRDSDKIQHEHLAALADQGPLNLFAMISVVTGAEDLACKDMWKRIGFIRHASEYWLLASLMLEKISAAATKPKSPEFVSRALTDNASTVIDPGGTEGFESALERYDETSMRQVNELLADFQKVQIAFE
ncbi:hypothetical protein LTR96_011460 [Exophiala xenobiotica]|nr:hypothetical protein LTR72_011631 [Exophiala xenobiotica]KAK5263112.1 hypothetical protein LTR96_011460 [Exophiala xenobiotica]KAK5284647.1 hypothetical protein LTR14_011602 [Exophiala xenobiotica]